MLSLKMAAVPLDTAEHLYVQLSGIETTAADGTTTTYYYCSDPANPGGALVSKTPCTTPAPRRIDLVPLGGSQTASLLNDLSVPAGRYNALRLLVDSAGPRDTYIVVQGGTEHELVITDADRPRLQISSPFDVPANGRADMIAILDLRKSVTLTFLADYQLTPHLRLVDNARAGTIIGEVDRRLTPNPGCSGGAVYVFSGENVTPDDIDGNAVEPITIALVRLDNQNRYRASFLNPGSYTVAFTCLADQDRPTGSEALAFFWEMPSVTVSPQAVITRNFPQANSDDDDD